MKKRFDAVKLQREIREGLGREYWSDRKAYFRNLKRQKDLTA
jgi:hypothetical protein